MASHPAPILGWSDRFERHHAFQRWQQLSTMALDVFRVLSARSSSRASREKLRLSVRH
jgi:hypothetical protein